MLSNPSWWIEGNSSGTITPHFVTSVSVLGPAMWDWDGHTSFRLSYIRLGVLLDVFPLVFVVFWDEEKDSELKV